ncbi:hypothetical protein OQZ33_23450 [Pedobacter sp. MC2016-05]|uniref:hypothetical protein n=1 Tax=Pedobacter sp. MC2016-05 TaxID=2994474 RepID=UPI0022454FB8|nr:hypothetical protein [Pedobacter sp. MC2016-05]MCX2477310.1 hypothetical protein [Pedobacter sp. MC2016-05]
MKNSILTVIFALGFLGAVKAQNFKKHEINIAYSDGTPLVLSKGLGEALGAAIINAATDAQVKESNGTTIGVFNAGYRFNVNERFAVGGDLAYLRNTKLLSESGSTKQGKRVSNYAMVFGTGEYSYVKTKLINFYGSASVGVIADNTKETFDGKSQSNNQYAFAYQINPLGLSVGKSLAGFVELGYGYKGFASIGLKYRF